MIYFQGMGVKVSMKMEAAMYNEPEQQAQMRFWNESLARLGRDQDRSTYIKLYDHFAPRLNAWLLGVTRDQVLAEELVQDTMLAVWRKADRYDPSKAAASTWIFRIARNLHIDHLRRAQVRDRNRSRLVEEDTTFDEQPADADRIRSAMRQLPVQQAQVIYKTYFEGKSHQEIANDMDIPLGSVKSSLRLAFKKLSKALRP